MRGGPMRLGLSYEATAVKLIVRAAARRLLDALRMSIALGSSTGSPEGGTAGVGDVAGGEACGACCDGWALAFVTRNTPNASSSAQRSNVSRLVFMVSSRIRTSWWQPERRSCR